MKKLDKIAIRGCRIRSSWHNGAKEECRLAGSKGKVTRNNDLLGLGDGALTEAVLEAAGKVTEVAQTARARRLAADGLHAPVVWGGGE